MPMYRALLLRDHRTYKEVVNYILLGSMNGSNFAIISGDYSIKTTTSTTIQLNSWDITGWKALVIGTYFIGSLCYTTYVISLAAYNFF